MSQFNAALLFVYLPDATKDTLKEIVRSLQESGAKISNFFHKNITHLITSQNAVEAEQRRKLVSKHLLANPASRGAMLLSKVQRNRDALSIVQKAQFFGVKIVFVENMKVHFSENSKSIAPKYDEQLASKIVKVWELKPPFLKIVDRSGCYRPLVAEMKDWPVDPFKMFSQGPDVLDDKPIRERKISYCELCENRCSNLETQLKSCQHKKNAGDSKIWERVDALISRGPSLKQLEKLKLEQLHS